MLEKHANKWNFEWKYEEKGDDMQIVLVDQMYVHTWTL